MNSIGICGNFGRDKESGQTVKTNMTYEQIVKLGFCCGKYDTYGLNKKSISGLIGLVKFLFQTDNLVIMPAENGLKVIAPIISMLNIFCRHNLWYIVIGGWLPAFLQQNHSLIKYLKKFRGIFVESVSMQTSLAEIGLTNSKYIPNFKNLDRVKKIKEHFGVPFRICTFSRVTKEKGIEDAIATVKLLNSRSIVATLDIYGVLNDDYRERFLSLLSECRNIKYKGVIDSSHTTIVLKEYDALIFPTYYEGEGFPGTLLDAMYSGIPVVASDWKYNSEIIKDGVNGFIVPVHDIEGFVRAIIKWIEDEDLWRLMCKNSLDSSAFYNADDVISSMLQVMGL